MSAFPRVRPVGDAALTLELGVAIDAALNARVRAVDRRLRQRPFAGFLECVPTHRSLLVLFDPERLDFDAARCFVLDVLTDASEAPEPGRLHVLPTVYGGEHGPDLADVARRAGLSEARVVALHSEGEYCAAMLGFAPGFAYLGTLPAELETPRLATPRTRVAPGSVAIAGRQTAVYPSASAGGWNLIGRSAAPLFDASRDPPALIAPGDRVRFEPVTALPEIRATPVFPPVAHPALELLSAGLLTSVQDAGRPAFRRFGVSTAGALDPAALAVANEAVGNPPDAAVLECTALGPRLRFLEAGQIAIAGADLGAVIGSTRVPLGVGVAVEPGDVLSFGERRDGFRVYVAFAGGIDVPVVLGARATDLHGAFGGFLGRALRKGDRLAVGASRGAARASAAPRMPPGDGVTVRVVPGPQDDAFDADTLERLCSESWLVGTESDRAALRLVGPPLSAHGSAEIVSDGLLPGCIQVPRDGRPIVMLADAPTTGGYAKLATVRRSDLQRLAQLVPGLGRVRFERA